MKYFLSFIILFSMVALMNGEKDSCPFLDTEYSGPVLHEIDHVISWQACWEACKLTPFCLYWSWDTKNKHACFLKSHSEGTHDRQGYISGEKQCH